jgi:uncharacterized protein YndB with AHSA1/START domain
MTTPAPDKATALRRTFPAARERVFHAWTEREALQQWFRPAGRGVIISKLDVQVGGAHRFDSVDGSNAIVGAYLEIVRPEKLVFTWSFVAAQGIDTVVTVEFLECGPVTVVSLPRLSRMSRARRNRLRAILPAFVGRAGRALVR